MPRSTAQLTDEELDAPRQFKGRALTRHEREQVHAAREARRLADTERAETEARNARVDETIEIAFPKDPPAPAAAAEPVVVEEDQDVVYVDDNPEPEPARPVKPARRARPAMGQRRTAKSWPWYVAVLMFLVGFTMGAFLTYKGVQAQGGTHPATAVTTTATDGGRNHT